MGYTHFKS